MGIEGKQDLRSDRRQAELLEQVFQADPGALALLVGPELRFAAANATYRRLLLGDADPTGRTFAEVWPDASMRPVEDRLREVIGGAAPLRTDRDERLCGDGRRRLFTSHAAPLSWEGRPAVLAVLWETTALEEARRDTEQYAQEAAARAAELQAVLTAMPVGLAIYDPHGRIVAINEVAERLLHFRPEDWTSPVRERWGALLLQRADGEPLGFDDLPVQRALRGEVVRNLEMRVRRASHPEQRPTWVAASASPVRGRDGTPLGAVATFTDVTHLRELHEEREDLFRMVSHDLRTPLTAILAQAQLLARAERSPDDVRRRAESIEANAQRMAAMIRDLAELVGLEGGQVRLEPGPVDVTATAREILQRLGGSVPVERVRVEGGAPPALADRDALERVLVNLVTNALKFSPDPEPVVIRVSGDGDRIAVQVADRGPGITPDDQTRIFERFYRRAQHARSEGLGLGLYITRKLLDRMDGHVAVESAPGRGSVFTVTLPAAQRPSDVAASPAGP